jgi:hypothetical protein
MTKVLSNLSTPLTQELPFLPFQEIIEEYSASERGGHRIMVAILNIDWDFAEADFQAVAATADYDVASTPPALATAAYADDGQSPYFEASPLVPLPMARNAVAASRIGSVFIKAMRRASRRKTVIPKPARPRRAVKPQRPPRVTEVNSHAPHGGARKAGDDGGDAETPSKPDYGIWGNAKSYAAAERCGILDPIPRPRPGYVFVNANCECWRQQFSNLFCSNCSPIVRREVPLTDAERQ